MIRQDNAKPYFHDSDLDFVNVSQPDKFHIILEDQSANSPDLNINDLIFLEIFKIFQY